MTSGTAASRRTTEKNRVSANVSLYKSSDFAMKASYRMSHGNNTRQIDLSCDLDEVKESEVDSDNIIIDKSHDIVTDQRSDNVTMTLAMVAPQRVQSQGSDQRSSNMQGTGDRKTSAVQSVAANS